MRLSGGIGGRKGEGTTELAGHRGLAEAQMSARSPDGAKVPAGTPAGGRPGLDPEQCGDFGRRQEPFAGNRGRSRCLISNAHKAEYTG